MQSNEIMRAVAATLVMMLAAGCNAVAPKPTAKDVCLQLERAGIGKACTQVVPTMISARAKERYDLDLVSVPGKSGAVLSFANADDYKATVNAYTEAAMLAGPHRYGSEKALIFVQLNDGASLDVGNKTKSLVDGL